MKTITTIFSIQHLESPISMIEVSATQDWTTTAWDLPMFHLRSDVSIQDRTIFTQQDPSLVMKRPVVSTAQSIT